MAKRIIVFRFDRNPDICRRRIGALRVRNPDVPIVGLYGGASGYRAALFRAASRAFLGLDAFYASPQPGLWNWKNGDLALASWFRDEGHKWDFEVAHFVEWDLLLAAPLDELYSKVPTGAVGLTCLTPIDDVAEDWRWLSVESERAEYQELLDVALSGRGDGDAWEGRYASIGVGPCFPRQFLADFTREEPPALAHDELRVPLYAQILGFPLVDTGFRRAWVDSEEDLVFNAVGRAIDITRIAQELHQPKGRRAFHPVRTFVNGVG